jgi:hypothetical protein
LKIRRMIAAFDSRVLQAERDERLRGFGKV